MSGGKKRSTLGILLLLLLASPAVFTLVRLQPAAAASPPPQDPYYRRVQLSNTSFPNLFMSPNTPGLERAYGTRAAWSYTPIAQNGTYLQPVQSYGYLNPLTGSIEARGVPPTPGYSLTSNYLAEFYSSPRFDGGYVVELQTKDSNLSEGSFFIYNTDDGTSTRAVVPWLGGSNLDNNIAGTLLSSSGNYVTGVFRHQKLNNSWEYDNQGNLVEVSEFSQTVEASSGGTFSSVTPDSSVTMSTTCSSPGPNSYHYMVLFNPTTPVDVAAGGSGKFAYAVIDQAFDKPSPSDCQPLTYQTDVKLMLSDGITVATFHPRYTNTTKGVQTCFTVAPCYVGIVGFWDHLLVYRTCTIIVNCTGNSTDTLYDTSTGRKINLGNVLATAYVRTDGTDMLWTGSDGKIYLYDPVRGVEIISPVPFPPISIDFYAGGTRLSGGWASWVNDSNYVNMYHIPDGKLYATRVSDVDHYAYIDSPYGGLPFIDMAYGTAAWLTTEFSTRQILYIYNATGPDGPTLMKVNVDWANGIADLIETSPWLYLAATTPGNSQIQIFTLRPPIREPVIIVPGIAGTTLSVGSRELWLGLRHLYSRADLALPSGPGVIVSVGDVLRTGLLYTRYGSNNAYGGLIDYFTSKGYTENVDLYTFPYDWRLDNQGHYGDLDKLVAKAVAASGAAKVILIAHSMGGLISRGWMLSNDTRPFYVDTLITIDTPFWGAPKAFYAITMGYSFANPLVNPKEMKIISQNVPAAYQLMPRTPFIFDKTLGYNRLLTLGETYSLMYKSATCPSFTFFTGYPKCTESKNNVWTFNPALLSAASTFWSVMGTPRNPAKLPYGVKFYSIVGDGVQTFDNMTATPAGAFGPEANLTLPGHTPTGIVLDPVFADGDGTVPLWSEVNNAANLTYYVQYERESFPFFDVSSEHVPMASNTNTLAIIGEILDAGATLRTPGIPTGSPLYATYISTRYVPLTGGFGLYESENFAIHSNATLSVTDVNTGASVGPRPGGGVYDNNETASFLDLGGVQYVSVRDTSKTYLVTVNGTGTGEFSLTVNLVGGPSGNLTFSYPNVQVAKGTVAQIQVNASAMNPSSTPVLKVTSPSGTVVDVLPGGSTETATSSSKSTQTFTTLTSSPTTAIIATQAGQPPWALISVGVAAVAIVLVAAAVRFVRKGK